MTTLPVFLDVGGAFLKIGEYRIYPPGNGSIAFVS